MVVITKDSILSIQKKTVPEGNKDSSPYDDVFGGLHRSYSLAMDFFS